MQDLSIVILAGGNGKRMHSSLPKVLHQVGGVSLLERVVATAQLLNPSRIFVVYGQNGHTVQNQLSHLAVTWVEQPEQLGTGHALLQAIPLIPDDHKVLVLYGDVPLISLHTLKALLDKTNAVNSLCVLVADVENPTGFGRIMRDDSKSIISIVEQKDATAEQLLIREINTGIMVARAQFFKHYLPKLSRDNAQSEYYLTDIVKLAVQEKKLVVSVTANCPMEVLGVNTRPELVNIERYYQQQFALRLLNKGVVLYDVNRFDCRGNLQVEEGAVIDVNVIFEGNVSIARGASIGPHCVIRDAIIGENVMIASHCVIDGATIGRGCKIGPFARIRPHTKLAEDVHIGNFVELKKTQVGKGTKANHLSYLGDSQIGEEVNIGAGTITCNYDGVKKYPTIIEDNVFIGSGTELVAPLVIGKGAYIGAGSTITKDAPNDELTLARPKQTTIKGWKSKKKVEK